MLLYLKGLASNQARLGQTQLRDIKGSSEPRPRLVRLGSAGIKCWNNEAQIDQTHVQKLCDWEKKCDVFKNVLNQAFWGDILVEIVRTFQHCLS
jgi:hypothetical protein